MSLKENIETWIAEALKATPASATLTLSLFGIPLTQWATILSIVVLLLQGYFLIRNNTGGKNGISQKQAGSSDSSRSTSGNGPDRGV